MAISSEHRSWQPERETCIDLRDSAYHAETTWEADFLGRLHGCIRRGCPDAAEFRRLAEWIDLTRPQPVEPALDAREEWYLGWRALIGSTVWEEPFASRDEAMIAARIVKHFGAVGITVGRHGIPEPVEPAPASR